MPKFSTDSPHMAENDIINIYKLKYLLDKDKNNFYKWLTGKDGASEDIIQARKQAIQAYPTLAYEIYNVKKIREVVERKKPLAPILAEYLKVDEKVLKRIQGKNMSDLRIKSRHYIYDIIRLKEKYFQQFKNNLSDLNILSEYASSVYYMSIHEFLDYLSLRDGKPIQYIKRMKENSVYDVRDGFEFLRTRLFLPALLNKIKDHAEKNNLIFSKDIPHWSRSRKLLIDYTNIKTILDFSERYHRNLFRWDDMLNLDYGIEHISWKPMFGKIDCGDGWVAREIDSIADMKDQGRRENHCVGGYAGSILDGDEGSARLIFSLEKDREIKSTIHMLCSKNENGNRINVEILQNRAHSNKDPSQEILDFSDFLVNKIKVNSVSQLDTYLYNLKHAQREYQKYQIKNKYVAECGYDPWNHDILQMVWEEFKPILPKKLRHLGLDGLIDMMPLQDIDFRPRKKNDKVNP